MKFLVTSDNHLGYKETDSIRGMDTFVTFEEILQIASKEQVDFIIQGGDLFHQNKPSRFTLNHAIRLIRQYCMGDRDINFQSNVPLNYHDPNLNIKIPIIAINGNHDDPCGHGSLSALDILHSAGLINYVGRITNYEQIVVKPVLLTGDQRIAIYVLGHVKDARLHRIFLQNRISYLRPDDYSSWFNILVLHQNRIPRREKDHIPEEFIDPMFDLVIYGHEHDTLLYNNLQKGFTMLQCGSSIRTSLCEGEVGEKRVYIVENGQVKHIPLQTVRPMILGQLTVTGESYEDLIKEKVDELIRSVGITPIENMNDFFIDSDFSRTILEPIDFENEEKPERNEDQEKLEDLEKLEDHDNLLINSENEEINDEFLKEENDGLELIENTIKNRKMLPLIRLRIDTSENIVLNRLSLLYKDKVANFQEMFLLRKIKRKEVAVGEIKKEGCDFIEIFAESLGQSKLELISEGLIIKSLRRFVGKDEKKSFEEAFSLMVETQLEAVKNVPLDPKELEKLFSETKLKMNQHLMIEEGEISITEKQENHKRVKKRNSEFSDVSDEVYTNFL